MNGSPSIDNLILGTGNAPWKRAIDAQTLAHAITLPQIEDLLPCLATFYGEILSGWVLDFASAHQIIATYNTVKRLTGGVAPKLEAALGVGNGS